MQARPDKDRRDVQDFLVSLKTYHVGHPPATLATIATTNAAQIVKTANNNGRCQGRNKREEDAEDECADPYPYGKIAPSPEVEITLSYTASTTKPTRGTISHQRGTASSVSGARSRSVAEF